MVRSSICCRFLLIAAGMVGASGQPAASDEQPFVMLQTDGPSAACRWMAFTDEGRTLLTAGDDRQICVWDVRQPSHPELDRRIRIPLGPGRNGRIFAGAISPNGRWLAVGGYYEQQSSVPIYLIDLNSDRIVSVLDAHTNVILGLSFSADGLLLASASGDKTVRVWDLGTGVETDRIPSVELSGHGNAVSDVQMVPDGTGDTLVSASLDETARIWSRNNGVWTVRHTLAEHTGPIWKVAVSPDGKWIATSSTDRSVRLWDATSGEPVGLLDQRTTDGDGFVPAISFSADSRRLAIVESERAGGGLVCSVPDGRPVCRSAFHSNVVRSAAFSPDNRLVASAGGDLHTVHLWDGQTGESVGQIEGSGAGIYAVAFSPDSRRIAFGQTPHGATLAANGKLTGCFDLTAMRPEILPDTEWQRAVITSPDIQARPVESGNVLELSRDTRQVCRIERRRRSDRINCFSYVDGSKWIAVGSQYNLSIHDVETGELLRKLEGHDAEVTSVAVSPDGRFLVSGSVDQTFRLWNLRDSGETSNVRPLLSFVVTRDGRWIVWAESGCYLASPGGDHLIGWLFNRKDDPTPEFLDAWQLKHVYHRPDLIREIPTQGSADFIRGESSRSALEIPELRRRFPPAVVDLHRPIDMLQTADGTVRLQADVGMPESSHLDDQVTVTVTVNHRKVPEWYRRVVDPHRKTAARLLAGSPDANDAGGILPRDFATRNIVRAGFRPKPPVDPAGTGKPGTPNAEDDRKFVIDAVVPLSPGINTIRIVAETDTTVSRVTQVRVERTTGSLDRPGLYVLAVGVSEYEDAAVNDLKYARRDADLLVDLVGKQAELFSEFADVQTRLLTDTDAGREQILAGLQWLDQNVHESDVGLVLFSGHGVTDEETYYFAPHDAVPDRITRTGLSADDILGPLRKEHSGRFVVVMDTCHSRAVADALYRDVDRQIDHEPGLFVLSGALRDESAIERSRWKHGTLTLALLESLSSQFIYTRQLETPLYAQDTNGSGFLELPELHQYTVRRVKELEAGQQHVSGSPWLLSPGLKQLRLTRIPSR